MKDSDAIAASLGVKSHKTRMKRTMPGAMKYPGGKTDLLHFLLPQLPYRRGWVDVFAGSAVVTLNRKPSNFECINDRYGAIIHFYRILRTRPRDLINRLELMVHSREEWEDCLATWETVTDPLEIAARWYYMIHYSFLGQGRSFARVTSPASPVSGTISKRLEAFPLMHSRLARVQVENLDWSEVLKDFDDPDTVFYCDPTYLNADTSSYKYVMTLEDHEQMLKQIMGMKGFVAVSNYPNDLYMDKQWQWTRMLTCSRRDRANAQAVSEFNGRSVVTAREDKLEVLWIRDPTSSTIISPEEMRRRIAEAQNG